MDEQIDLVHTNSGNNPSEVSNITQKRDKLIGETDNFVQETLQKLGRRNFWLYVNINILSLLLTLSITVVGLLDEQQIPANQRKILTGTLGAILATL